MIKLNRDQTVELQAALSAKDLKAKHISGENFMKLIGLSRSLKKQITALVEQETEIATALGATTFGGQLQFPDPESIKLYNEKTAPIHKAFSFEFDGNFIPENELREYTKEQDTAVVAILFEYLLKP